MFIQSSLKDRQWIRVIAAFGLLGASASALAMLNHPVKLAIKKLSANSATAQAQPRASFRQMVRVWVRGDGLAPDLIVVRPGKISFNLENQTLSDVRVTLTRQNQNLPPQAVGLLQTERRNKRAEKEFEVAPGEYRYFLTDYPQFQGTLLVTNK